MRFLSLLLTLLIGSSWTMADEAAKPGKTVLLAVLAKDKGHVLPTFFKCIEDQEYDKKLITIYINTNNNKDNTVAVIEDFIKRNQGKYRDIIYENHNVNNMADCQPHQWTTERFKILARIRNKSMRKAQETKSDYYFVVDCDNFIVPNTLKTLIEKDKPIIAPMLRTIPYQANYSNYFIAVDNEGYFTYDDFPEYLKILGREKKGTFQVPLVHCTYLINSKYIDDLSYYDESDDYEFVIFARWARNNKVDQFICNEQPFGTILYLDEGITLAEEAAKFKEIKDVFKEP